MGNSVTISFMIVSSNILILTLDFLGLRKVKNRNQIENILK